MCTAGQRAPLPSAGKWGRARAPRCPQATPAAAPACSLQAGAGRGGVRWGGAERGLAGRWDQGGSEEEMVALLMVPYCQDYMYGRQASPCCAHLPLAAACGTVPCGTFQLMHRQHVAPQSAEKRSRGETMCAHPAAAHTTNHRVLPSVLPPTVVLLNEAQEEVSGVGEGRLAGGPVPCKESVGQLHILRYQTGRSRRSCRTDLHPAVPPRWEQA